MLSSSSLSSKKGNSTETASRYLRVGNLPVDATPENLMRFLNTSLREVNMCYFFEQPIRNCLIYNCTAFVGFTTSEMAGQALGLNGITYLGNQLNLGRPNQSVGATLASSNSWKEIGSSEHEKHILLLQAEEEMDRMKDIIETSAHELRTMDGNHAIAKRIRTVREQFLNLVTRSICVAQGELAAEERLINTPAQSCRRTD